MFFRAIIIKWGFHQIFFFLFCPYDFTIFIMKYIDCALAAKNASTQLRQRTCQIYIYVIVPISVPCVSCTKKAIVFHRLNTPGYNDMMQISGSSKGFHPYGFYSIRNMYLRLLISRRVSYYACVCTQHSIVHSVDRIFFIYRQFFQA